MKLIALGRTVVPTCTRNICIFPTPCICVSYDCRSTYRVISQKDINRLVFVIETQCVYCEEGTVLLNSGMDG